MQARAASDARSHACRPAVIISYLIGALIAVITAANYAEMGADYPLAGASFKCACVLGAYEW